MSIAEPTRTKPNELMLEGDQRCWWHDLRTAPPGTGDSARPTPIRLLPVAIQISSRTTARAGRGGPSGQRCLCLHRCTYTSPRAAVPRLRVMLHPQPGAGTIRDCPTNLLPSPAGRRPSRLPARLVGGIGGREWELGPVYMRNFFSFCLL